MESGVAEVLTLFWSYAKICGTYVDICILDPIDNDCWVVDEDRRLESGGVEVDGDGFDAEGNNEGAAEAVNVEFQIHGGHDDAAEAGGHDDAAEAGEFQFDIRADVGDCDAPGEVEDPDLEDEYMVALTSSFFLFCFCFRRTTQK